jgi:glycosyltransferase involved in cell wall biosynthesis
MPRVSVVICCANVADMLEAACRSVAWADELVVVDSGSTDATGEIAQRLATRYVVEPWRGYTEQKRFGVGLCRNDWTFVLDGDEEVSPALGDEICRLTEEEMERRDLFLMRRRNYVMGRYVRAFSPDWQNRLIHRGRCRWADANLHDRRIPSHPSRAARLRGWMEHRRHSQAGFADYFDGRLAETRVKLAAEQMFRQGRQCTWLDLLLRPPAAFAKFYLLKQGFLDGQFGLLIAQRAAWAVQLRYATLWARQHGAVWQTVERDPDAAAAPPSAPAGNRVIP